MDLSSAPLDSLLDEIARHIGTVTIRWDARQHGQIGVALPLTENMAEPALPRAEQKGQAESKQSRASQEGVALQPVAPSPLISARA